MTITKDEIDKIMNDPMTKLIMDALAEYDNRYIGNVPKEKAIELGLFKKDELPD